MDYYSDTLSAERLRRCYDIAQPRIVRYLEAEVDHVLSKITRGSLVLELGCGYGRVLGALARKAGRAVGIDTSFASLVMGRAYFTDDAPVRLLQMDAVHLGFADGAFDTVCCIQNGISAFHVDQRALIAESVRVTKRGGLALFSSYSERIWEDRLEWFRLQSAEGLIGEIDLERSKDGMIACTDGFTATTVGPERFLELAYGLGTRVAIVEVDESSVFCEITI